MRNHVGEGRAMLKTSLKDRYKLFRKDRKRKDFLKQLVNVYSNPALDRRHKFSHFPKSELDAFYSEIAGRFPNDKQTILVRIEKYLGIASFSTASLQDSLTLRYQDCKNQEVLGTVIEILNLLKDNLRDFSTEPTPELALADWINNVENQDIWQKDRRVFVQIILDQVIEPRKVPLFYDYDHIHDLIGIIKGR
jgi:hypothetical protein